jgi:hydroxypyruvate isomerase
MPRLAANLTMLFNEVPFLERFERAAAAGFTAVECMFPYDHDADVLRQKLDAHGLVQVLHNLPAGNWAAGDRGIACVPGRVGEFEAGVEKAIHYATTLACRQVNCLAGVRPPDVDVWSARRTLVGNLQYAAPRFAAAGIRLLVEPVNTRDIPGFFLCHTAQAIDIMDEVGSDNLFLQYDAYHMQIMEGDLAPTIERLLPRIAHIQIADTPGRHEPGTGEINYSFLLGFIDRVDYRGQIGCEYKPATTTEAGLGWTRPYLTRS